MRRLKSRDAKRHTSNFVNAARKEIFFFCDVEDFMGNGIGICFPEGMLICDWLEHHKNPKGRLKVESIHATFSNMPTLNPLKPFV